jgi:putative tryptophan/tyrosine transport system ATP-binding protein
MLTLKNIVFSVPNRDEPIVNGVSFSVAAHDFIVLLGSNGSGKSTLMRLINRSYKLHSGEIDFFQQPLDSYNDKELAKSIVTITQNTRDNLFTNMTIMENSVLYDLRYQAFFDKKSKRQRRQALQDYLALFSHKLAGRLEMTVNLLSGGEQQILILALCLRHPPKLLLLDEHTSALDPKTAESMMEMTYKAIKERDITCIMTTHNLAFAEKYGNRLIVLKEGEINKIFEVEEKKNLASREILKMYY